MKRSESYMMAYRHAWRDAIAFVYAEAKGMNDPRAVAVLEALAHSMGVRKHEMKEGNHAEE